VRLPRETVSRADGRPYEVRDLLTDEVFRWQGEWNFVRLDPDVRPAHILRIERTTAST